MGKAVGGGVYSLDQTIEQPDPAKPGILKRIKVDLESVEFEGDMNATQWADLKAELDKLAKSGKYGKLKVRFQSRPSKP